MRRRMGELAARFGVDREARGGIVEDNASFEFHFPGMGACCSSGPDVSPRKQDARVAPQPAVDDTAAAVQVRRRTSRVHFAPDREEQPRPSEPQQYALPPGWAMGWSPEYSRHYYVNASLGLSQWEPPPQQQSPATRSQKLPPISSSSLSKGKLKPANVEAAMRERDAMRTAESRQRALQQQDDYQLALGLSRSRAEQQERPGEAAAAAAAAALRRAHSADGMRGHPGSSRSPGHLQPLPPLQHGVAPSVSSAPRTHTAAFNATVEERFNAWSTSMYASNSFLHEIGATARQEQRERIREALEVEWRAAGLPVFEGGAHGGGRSRGGLEMRSSSFSGGHGRRLGGR